MPFIVIWRNKIIDSPYIYTAKICSLSTLVLSSNESLQRNFSTLTSSLTIAIFISYINYNDKINVNKQMSFLW